MKWRPLLYRSPSRQPRQANAPAQYSNLKCVSRLRATLYNLLGPSVRAVNLRVCSPHASTHAVFHNENPSVVTVPPST